MLHKREQYKQMQKIIFQSARKIKRKTKIASTKKKILNEVQTPNTVMDVVKKMLGEVYCYTRNTHLTH